VKSSIKNNIKFYTFGLLVLLLTGCETLPNVMVADGEANQTFDEKLVHTENPYLSSRAVVSGRVERDFTYAIERVKAMDWPAAEASLKALILSQPSLSGPHLNLGIVYHQQERISEAEQAYLRAIEVNRLNLVAYNHLGILKREQGAFIEAEGWYLAALEIWPQHLMSLRNLGILYDLYLGQPTAALTQFKRYQTLSDEPDRQVRGWLIDIQRRLPVEGSVSCVGC
jgi:tetratricopeptide (TPR) repeat protein